MFTISDVLFHKAQRLAKEAAPAYTPEYMDEGLLNASEHPNDSLVWCKYHLTRETFIDYISHAEHWSQ